MEFETQALINLCFSTRPITRARYVVICDSDKLLKEVNNVIDILFELKINMIRRLLTLKLKIELFN